MQIEYVNVEGHMFQLPADPCPKYFEATISEADIPIANYTCTIVRKENTFGYEPCESCRQGCSLFYFSSPVALY